MDDLTVQLQDMFYASLGDEAESEKVQELIGLLHDFILSDRSDAHSRQAT